MKSFKKIIYIGFILLTFITGQVNAIGLNLERNFDVFPEKYIEKLANIDRLSQFIDLDKVTPKLFEFHLEKDRFFIVRFEGKYCTESCLTAFFMNDISNIGFQGLGFFSAKISLGDGWKNAGIGCGKMKVVFFLLSKNTHKGVHLSRCGILF